MSDAPVDHTSSKRIFTLKASLPATPESRAQVAYDNKNEDYEIFLWNTGDFITIFNLTRLSECPDGIEFDLVNIDGNIAEFESLPTDRLNIQVGDTILASFYETKRVQNVDGSYDERNIFTLDMGTEGNKPQYIVEHPDDSALESMKDNLRMYDVVVAEKDGEIPDVHFTHLSAIIRVSMRNASGHDIYPTQISLDYPSVSGNEFFFNTELYYGIVGNDSGGFGLKVYDDGELYSGSKPYTSSISTTINGKNGTVDVGESIHDGETYELYITTVPRIGNTERGNGLTIKLIENHDTDNPYSITIDGFDAIIEAGARYWFKLTATPDRTLMFSSKWDALQEELNKNKDEEPTPEP